ncbi:MAG: flagellar basal body-associated FliL family protein [Tissierellia bacterium]|nr:flagellar basal body-associated FliL family protein [Tissierellia bacterium]
MKGKLNIKILIIALIILIVAGVAVVFFLKSKASSEEEKAPNPSSEVNYSVTMEDMYCNIKNSKRILKIKLTIQTSDENKKAIIEAKQFVIRDEANKIIRNNTEEDLLGTGSMENLKRAIQRSLSNYFADESIVVFFDEFVIQ